MLTTPLLGHLANSGAVDVVTTPAGATLLAGNAAVRRVIAYDKRSGDSGLGGIRRLADALRVSSPDAVAYLAQGSLRSATLAFLARYRHRVGFDTSSGRWLYTRRITYRADQHHAERLLRLAIGDDTSVSAIALKPSLYPSSADRDAVSALLAEHGALDDRLIALAPGSVWATKRWPGYPALARSLAKHGRIVVIGGAGDHALASAIRSAMPDAIDATGRLGMLASAELIRRSAILVTNDSLPQHLASAMGTATVTVFGPTIPGFGFGPLAPGSSTAGYELLRCRPCHPHGPPACPLGHHRCMQDLAAADVLSRALEALSTHA